MHFLCSMHERGGECRRREPFFWGAGGMPPTKFLILGARECHFPQFPGDSLINQNMENIQYLRSYVV